MAPTELYKMMPLARTTTILLLFTSLSMAAEKKNMKENIHQQGKCNRCHQMDQGTGKTKAALLTSTPSELCMSCHPNPIFMHAIKLNKESLKVPADFPLENGNFIGCATCHEEAECRGKTVKLTKYLRSGPYANVQDFCYKCHQNLKISLSKINPHLEQAITDPAKKADACFYCHTTNPYLVKITYEKPHLKIESDKLCYVCHSKYTHLLSSEHLDKKLSPEKQAILQRESKKQNVYIPLAANNTITCATCHEPHVRNYTEEQKTPPANHWFAVFKENATEIVNKTDQILPRKEARTLRRPVKDNSLCQLCHE
jgi:predicted CXXCH cytochrome family protein